MTLNERFVGGNPRSLIAFILFVLICFVGICPNMIRKKKKEKKRNFFFGDHDQELGTALACGGTTVPTHQHTKTKKISPSSLIQTAQPLSSSNFSL